MMKRSKNPTVTVNSQVRELGARLSFLDVLRETCQRDGRYTLNVETGDSAYTVLVDRGGPFNAIGGGTAGSPSLVKAAQLRQGRCTVTMGWPVDQPLYQPGLDLTLKALVDGVVEPAGLPQHRGVDSLRNAEWRDATVLRAAAPQPPAVVREPETPPEPPVRTEVFGPAAQAVQAPAVTEQPGTPAQVPGPAPAPEADATAVAAPAPEAPAEPRMVWKQVGSRDVWTTETDLPVTFTEPTVPREPRPAGGDVAPATGARKLATSALLWMLETEDTGDVTLEQAAGMARRELVNSLSQAFHPFRKDLSRRVDRIREDWEKSGEAAKRVKRKKIARQMAVAEDPDREFRL